MGFTYLFPIDPSPNCRQAALFYLERLHREGDSLVFVHVVDSNSRGPAVNVSIEHNSPLAVDIPKSATRLAVAEGKLLLQKYLEWSREEGIPCRSFLHVDASPGGAVLKAAKNAQADHIVLASRGLNALGRTLLGSMSSYIVHHSTIPVTVVPVPQSEKTNGIIRRLSLH